MKLLVLLLLLCVSAFAQEQCQSCPTGEALDRQFPNVLPDAPSKTVTKKFIAAHSVYLGSVLYDVEMTHQGIAHHRCVEGNGDERHPSRGELYRNDLIPFAVLTGFDLLIQYSHPPKAFRWIPYMAPTYGSALHIRGGTRWAMNCW